MCIKVSIIIPIYNVESYLENCIESLINQTYKEIEIILVNDESPDNSLQICKEYAMIDSRVRIINKKNGGLSDARNAGLKVATGEYVIFVDGDDFVQLNLVEKALESALKTSSDIVIWGFYADFVNDIGELEFRKEYGFNYNIFNNYLINSIKLDDTFVGLLGYAWNKLYKKEILDQHNFEFTKDLSLVEDIEFNSRVLQKSNNIVFIEEILTHYIQRDRTTLGAKFYPDFLELKSIAYEAQSKLLNHMKIDQNELEKYLNIMKLNTLKSYFRMHAKKFKNSDFYIYNFEKDISQSFLRNITYSNDFSVKERLIFLLYKFKAYKLLLTMYKKI